eukprot:COSAG06_NODE_5722_length_3306_cov_1.883692_4_plen_38_part_00
MPPVTYNMIPGMRAYYVVNRGILARGELWPRVSVGKA